MNDDNILMNAEVRCPPHLHPTLSPHFDRLPPATHLNHALIHTCLVPCACRQLAHTNGTAAAAAIAAAASVTVKTSPQPPPPSTLALPPSLRPHTLTAATSTAAALTAATLATTLAATLTTTLAATLAAAALTIASLHRQPPLPLPANAAAVYVLATYDPRLDSYIKAFVRLLAQIAMTTDSE